MVQYNEWHFKDVPILAPDFDGPTIEDPVNSDWATSQLYNTLKASSSSGDADLMKSFAIRFLIHIIGDIHQPLHSSAYYSKQFPTGDQGGNLFKIRYKDYNELHALWDAACDKYGDASNQDLPLNDQGIAYLENEASTLMNAHPRSEFEEELKLFYFGDWIQESWQHAQDHVYKGLTPGQEISDEYIQNGVLEAQKRITLAGYRLANVIGEIYENSDFAEPNEEAFQQAASILRRALY